MHERPLRLEREEDAREQLGSSKLFGQPLPAPFSEQNAQIRGGVDVEPLRRHRDQPWRLPGRRSSSRISRYFPRVGALRTGWSLARPNRDPTWRCSTSAGDREATGRRCRVMRIRAPAAAWSTNEDKCRFSSYIDTVFMVKWYFI